MIADYISYIVGAFAFVLSIINARLTWWKPFVLGFFPRDEGIIGLSITNENECYIQLTVDATICNLGSELSHILAIALIRVKDNKIVSKIHLAFMGDPKSLSDDLEKYGILPFTGITLLPNERYFGKVIFEGLMNYPKGEDPFDTFYVAYKTADKPDKFVTSNYSVTIPSLFELLSKFEPVNSQYLDIKTSIQKKFNKWNQPIDTIEHDVKAKG